MKKALKLLGITAALAALLSGCGVGSYSVASGKEDSAAITFTDDVERTVVVTVDGTSHTVETVKVKAYKPGMRVKQTALNTVKIGTGTHKVVVTDGNEEIFNKTLFIAAGECKVINL